ncbi:MAG TPA: transcriptional repressor LexA [Bdellovibrionota bacterium]|nr:transcriptional repressor LexA [Bdellovibrionota bacterium]
MDLTDIQKKVLEYIEREVGEGGTAPSLREICHHFRFNAVGTAQDHVRALIQKGYLERDSGKARGLRLAGRHRAASSSVPLLGAIAAGNPREAAEIMLGSIPVPSRLTKKGNLFALRVEGDSMIGAGIHDGDVVIARQQNEAENGDIVVVLVDGSATVKRFEKRGTKLLLLPENPAFKPIPIQSESSIIQGKVVAIQRYYE